MIPSFQMKKRFCNLLCSALSLLLFLFFSPRESSSSSSPSSFFSINCDVFSPLYTRLRCIPTLPTSPTFYLRFSLQASQAKANQLQTKKGYQILSQVILPNNLYRSSIYIYIHLIPNTSLSYSLLHTLSSTLFRDVKGLYNLKYFLTIPTS